MDTEPATDPLAGLLTVTQLARLAGIKPDTMLRRLRARAATQPLCRPAVEVGGHRLGLYHPDVLPHVNEAPSRTGRPRRVDPSSANGSAPTESAEPVG